MELLDVSFCSSTIVTDCDDDTTARPFAATAKAVTVVTGIGNRMLRSYEKTELRTLRRRG